jgi:hypothetical protein
MIVLCGNRIMLRRCQPLSENGLPAEKADCAGRPTPLYLRSAPWRHRNPNGDDDAAPFATAVDMAMRANAHDHSRQQVVGKPMENLWGCRRGPEDHHRRFRANARPEPDFR